jgi:hypothetical protein
MMVGGELRPFAELLSSLAPSHIPIVPVVAVVEGLQAALEFDIEFDSQLSPEGTGLGTNICEGVVIAPYRKIYRNAGGHTFLLKRKNEAFKEKQKVKRPPEPEDSEVARLNAEFRTYITDMRLQAVFSKEGEIERPDQIGDFIRLVLADAKEDFLQDNQEAVDALDRAKQKRVFNIGSMIANLLKARL